MVQTHVCGLQSSNVLLNVSIITTVFVVVLTKEKSFKTIKEDMKYENPFHGLPLGKDTLNVKIYVIPVQIRLDFHRYFRLYKISLTASFSSLFF